MQGKVILPLDTTIINGPTLGDLAVQVFEDEFSNLEIAWLNRKKPRFNNWPQGSLGKMFGDHSTIDREWLPSAQQIVDEVPGLDELISSALINTELPNTIKLFHMDECLNKMSAAVTQAMNTEQKTALESLALRKLAAENISEE